jgi:hypothetical protein
VLVSGVEADELHEGAEASSDGKEVEELTES